MKQLSKLFTRTGKILVLAVLLAGIAIVQPAAAADCTTINNLASKNTGAISTKLGAMTSDFSNRLTKIGTDIDGLDKKISDARTAATTAFEGKVTDLEATENLSADQKTAIEQYKTDMETAEKTRETSVDAARTTYRSGVTDAVKSYQDKLTSAANSFKATAGGYFDWAKTQCADNKNQTTIITWLKGYISTTRSTFSSARSTSAVNGTIGSLKTTRDQAIAAANSTFADAAKASAATLSTALGAVQNSASPDQSTDQSATDSTDQTPTDGSTDTTTAQ